MLIFRAMYRGVSAFCTSLRGAECSHENVCLNKRAAHCPDCGYQVRLLWSILRCRTCGSKRLPKQGLDGQVAPMYRYCQDCGGTDYRLIKKTRIHAHEVAYAISGKETDYSEERKAFAQKPHPHQAASKGLNPFKQAFDVVEGEVLASRYVTP